MAEAQDIRLETTGLGGNCRGAGAPGGGARPIMGTSPVGTNGPYHFTVRGVEAAKTARGRVSRLGGGSEWTRPEAGLVETERLVLYRDATSSLGSVQSSDSDEPPTSQPSFASLPTSERRMSGQAGDRREKVPCPKCGSRVQRQYFLKHNKNMHQGGRCQIHVPCLADKPKTYSTFLDWTNHLSETHPTCIHDGDPLLRAKYATGF